MIRSPHAFLFSVLLHGLIILLLLFVIAPKILKTRSVSPQRCRISLAQVVPAVPAAAEPEKKAPPPPKKKPEPVRKRTVAKPKPKPVPKKTVPLKKVRKKVPPKKRPEPVVRKTPEKREAERKPPEPVVAETSSPTTVKRTGMKESRPAEKRKRPQSRTVQAATPVTAPRTVVQSRDDYLNEHLAKIVELLQENLYYPRMARKRRIQGEVLVAFTLEKDGTVRNTEIRRHARPVLDRAAIETVTSLSGKMPHPKNVLTLEVPIRFVLH